MGIRVTLALAMAAVLGLSLTGTAEAAITVANQNDSGPGSLRQALAEAPPGETIVVPAGTYTLTSEPLKVLKSVTISGHGAGDTTIRAGGAFRVFAIHGPLDATIARVTIRDGSGSGTVAKGLGLEVIEASLTLREAVVTNNTANVNGTAGNGGGVAQGVGVFVVAGALGLIDSEVTRNTATARGGSEKRGGTVDGVGVFATGSQVTVANSTISGNTADAHGGEGSPNTEQYAGIAEGIGVWVAEGSLSVSDSSVTANSAAAVGGTGARGGIAEGVGIFTVLAPSTVARTALSGNSADVSGGQGPPALLKGGGIAEGIGIWVAEDPLSLADSKVNGNSAVAAGGSGDRGGITEGGGVWSAGRLVMTNTAVRGNFLDSHGGQGPSDANQYGGIAQGGGLWAIQEKAGGASSVTGSAVAENVIDASGGAGAKAGVAQGGGVWDIAASVETSFSTTTIAANVARGSALAKGGVVEGGGFWGIPEKAPLTLTATTLDGNRLEIPGPLNEATGGNLFSEEGIGIRDSIVADGVGPAGKENCNEPVKASLGFNLESLDQCGFHAGGDQVNKSPQLAPLQDNGGPTPTMAPAAGSPAVDQGAAFGLTTDQRGVVRPIDLPSIPNSSAPGADGSDIGAVEFQPSNALTLGKLKKNKKKGTATLTVFLPQPSVGALSLQGKGLKTRTMAITGQGEVKLKVIGKGGVKKALRKRGKRKVQINVTYAPTGNSPATATRKAKLVRKHRKHRKRRKHASR